MRFPWANTLLLIFIALDMVSGLLGLMSGSEDRAIYMQLHRVAGYGILAVLVWKTVNVVRSLRWPRSASVRLASIALSALLIVTLGLGFAWSLLGSYHWWLFSGVSWHIYVGAAILPFLAWHAWHMMSGHPIGFWAERRLALRAGAAAAVGLVGWQLSEGIARAADLAGHRRRFTGSYNAGDFTANAFPRVSWLNDRPQPIEVSTWTLRVTGEVDSVLKLGYEDLTVDADLPATIDCTGGWHSTQTWRGVRLGQILTEAGPTDPARSVVIHSVTGYYRRFPIGEADGLLLATEVTGETLSHGHGFPLRLVAPGRRGFEWVKWVTEIEVSDAPSWWQPPLPLQ